MSDSKEPSRDAAPEGLGARGKRQGAVSSDDPHQNTLDFFARAAASHDEKAFAAALAAVPDAPLLPGDEMR